MPTLKRSTTPKCRKCKRARVARQGQVCPGCQKPKRHTASNSRPVRGNASAVLTRSFPVASPSFFNDRAKQEPFFTTHDILQLRGLTSLTCSAEELCTASDLAHQLNCWAGHGAAEKAAVLAAYASGFPLPVILQQISTVPQA